jgi:hypothetical protein
MNQRQSFPGRVFYRASGGVRLGLFLLWLLPAIATAALMALLLFWLFLNGYYYLIVMPVLVSLPVAGLIRLAVGKGHCRNWLLGGLAGLCAAALLYLGYFYCGMVYHWGPRAMSRPDLLPAYIKARMKSDVVRDVGGSKESATRSTGMNWLMFGFDSSIIMLVGVFTGVQRSRKPYCEICKRWMMRHVTSLSPKASAAVLNALQIGSSQELAALCTAPVYSSVPYLGVGIDLCPSVQEGGSRGCPVYISAKQVLQSPNVAKADPIDQARGKVLLRTLQATSAEMVALAPRFKMLENITGASAFRPSVTEKPAPAVQHDLPVEISAVEPKYAGKVVSRAMIWGGTILTLAPLLTFFAGLGLMLWATTILEGTATPTGKFIAFGMLGVATVFMIGGLTVGLKNPSFLANRILKKRLRRELALRPKRMVNPDNPDALHVEIVPKANWGKLMLYSASDIGLLLLDQVRREVLFEGDRQRFRVPVDALTYSGLETFVLHQGHTKITYYYVVLRIESATLFWEAPIRLQTGSGLGRKKRKKEMTLLFDRIRQMRPALR